MSQKNFVHPKDVNTYKQNDFVHPKDEKMSMYKNNDF